MSLIFDGNGNPRPVVICKCGGTLTPMHVAFPNMRGYSCGKCGEAKIYNIEMAEMIMNQLVQQCGPPPHIITFERGLREAVGRG